MDMHKKADILKQRHLLAKKELLKLCQDKNTSLAIRWGIAVNNEWAFDTENLTIDWLDKYVKSKSLSAQFDLERYERVNLFSLLNGYFTEEECTLNNIEFFGKSCHWNDLEKVKELILQKGVYAFIHDW